MKTKIIKSEGYYKLIVDDPVINATSRFGGPIVLACITEFFHMKCWSFDDYRLKEHLIPSPYLNDSNDRISNFTQLPQEDKDLILSKVKTYTIDDDGHLFYWRFVTTDLDGDIPSKDKRRQLTDGSFLTEAACFTFKGAQAKLKEAKVFWDSYEGELTDPIVKRENKYIQPNSSSFTFEMTSFKEVMKKHKMK